MKEFVNFAATRKDDETGGEEKEKKTRFHSGKMALNLQQIEREQMKKQFHPLTVPPSTQVLPINVARG